MSTGNGTKKSLLMKGERLESRSTAVVVLVFVFAFAFAFTLTYILKFILNFLRSCRKIKSHMYNV